MHAAFFSSLLAVVTVALGATVEKRQGPTVMMLGCTGPSLTGTCGTFGLTTCGDLTGSAYYKTLNSVASTTTLYYCDLYTSTDCSGTPFVVEDGAETAQLPSPYADGVASFICFSS